MRMRRLRDHGLETRLTPTSRGGRLPFHVSYHMPTAVIPIEGEVSQSKDAMERERRFQASTKRHLERECIEATNLVADTYS